MRSSSGNGGGSASFSTSSAVAADLDLAGRQVVVDRALGPVPHRPRDPHDVLVAHAVHVDADRPARGRRRPARCRRRRARRGTRRRRGRGGRRPSRTRRRRARCRCARRSPARSVRIIASASSVSRRSCSQPASCSRGTSTCSPDSQVLHRDRAALGLAAAPSITREARARPVGRLPSAPSPTGRRRRARRAGRPRGAR